MLHFVWIQKICMLSVIQKLIASFTHALLLFHIEGDQGGEQQPAAAILFMLFLGHYYTSI